MLIAAIVVALLIGAFLLYRRHITRMDNPDIDSTFLESRHFSDDPLGDDAGHDATSPRSRKHANPIFDLVGDIDAEPIKAASILSKAGWNREAEQVLIKASLASPDRNDTLLELLDLYIAMRDEKGVTGIMCLLKTKTSADSPDRERATRAFEKSGIQWSAEMQQKFDNLVEKASTQV